MDGVVSLIMGSEPAQLVERLDRQDWTVTGPFDGLGLDPARHAVGMLYIARSQCRGEAKFSRRFEGFLSRACVRQLRMAPRVLASLCRSLAERACASPAPAALVAGRAIWTAVDKGEPDKCCLTPMHADVIQCFLVGKAYHLACRFVLEHPVTRVSSSETPERRRPRRTLKSGLEPVDLLRYFYYAGVALAGEKRWLEAAHHLKLCTTVPAACSSTISLAAYKKLAIASVMAGIPMPKRHFKNVAAYLDLVTAVESTEVSRVKKVIEQHEAAFTRDGNLGLAEQTVRETEARAVEKLKVAYLNLDLARVPGDIVSMIVTGRLDDAEIDAATGAVHFRKHKVDEGKRTRMIHDHVAKINSLNLNVQTMFEQIATNPTFLLKNEHPDSPSVAAVDFP